jgi:hypothetical protein
MGEWEWGEGQVDISVHVGWDMKCLNIINGKSNSEYILYCIGLNKKKIPYFFPLLSTKDR